MRAEHSIIETRMETRMDTPMETRVETKLESRIENGMAAHGDHTSCMIETRVERRIGSSLIQITENSRV